MDKARVNQVLILAVSAIFIAISIIFGFVEGSLDTLVSRGFSKDILYFLLIIPFVALLLSFFRMVIGFVINNTFITILIIISSFLTGPLFTLLMMIFSMITGYIIKILISPSRLHFAVKLSIILSVLSIGLLFFLPLIDQYARYSPGYNHFTIAYSMLVIALVNDRYFTFKMNSTLIRKNLINFASTLFFSYLCYFLLGGTFLFNSHLIYFSFFQEIIENYPDLIFLALFLQIWIGKYTGLRLMEVIRFRKILFKTR